MNLESIYVYLYVYVRVCIDIDIARSLGRAQARWTDADRLNPEE